MQTYRTHPAAPFYQLTKSIVESEITSGNTVSMISEVDLTEVERIRSASGARKPSYTAFVVKALALAMRKYPYANRRLYRGACLFSRLRFQQFSKVDIAVACERDEEGTEVATFIDVVRNADERSLIEIDTWLRTLAGSDAETNKQWRDYRWIATNLPGWLSSLLVHLPVWIPSLWAKYRGGAALVSSPAKYGVDMVNGSWTATLGVSFGFVKPRAVVVDGKVVARKTFHFLLNFDRRVMAGAPAARFFKHITDVLTNAETHLVPFLSESAAETKRTAAHQSAGQAVAVEGLSKHIATSRTAHEVIKM